MKLPFVIAAALAMVVGVTHPAQAKDAAPRKLAGRYLLATDDGRPADCIIRLKTDPIGKGQALDLTEECRQRLGLQSVTAWQPRGDLILFLSEAGTPVVTFQEDEELEAAKNRFVFSEANGGNRYLREWRDGDVLMSQKPYDAAGTWTMSVKSANACVLVLKKGASGDAGTVALQPGCRAEIAALQLAAWKKEGQDLLLLDQAGKMVQRYIALDPNSLRKQDDNTVMLGRPVRN
ncbi:exported hypothetical protein [Bradyrhizobium sp. STM 3843]|uniref:AprI/Inh family metalloprotease inhibitor n=1 Tax=Bradyrhizobium sp. STM 3843 TaxID=551947 RepID=UPI000240AF23|nr:AprI/Inh family metalloprotease inhibitor [Bradyrhizobium sp. STM 3843]CCE05710.1 exported hypothetical protein [Bradyrhizobium sp. STM 3843]